MYHHDELKSIFRISYSYPCMMNKIQFISRIKLFQISSLSEPKNVWIDIRIQLFYIMRA